LTPPPADERLRAAPACGRVGRRDLPPLPVPQQTIGKRLLEWVIYSLFLALVPVGVVVVFHHCYFRHVLARAAGPPVRFVPEIDEDTLRRVGWLAQPTARRLFFGNVSQAKPPGVERLGCYGDSFTWGDEVADGNDYPSRLQETLRRRGGAETEVVNFGVPGYGFHQTALLHGATASRWAIDRSVILALSFWTRRDTTFAWRSLDRFHARYVLNDHDDVALVDVVGTSHADRLAAYHRLVTPLEYLRFDRVPPAALRALLPKGRTVSNPFYYRSDSVEDEAIETYRRLLPRLREQTGDLLVLAPENFHTPLTRRPIGSGARVVQFDLPSGFPFVAPGGHLSPWGNRELAERIADILGAPAASWGRLRVASRSEVAGATPGSVAPGALHDVTVTLDDLRVGELFSVTHTGAVPVAAARLPPTTGSLVALLSQADDPLVDAVLIPRSETDDSRVSAVMDGRRLDLGDLEPVGRTIALTRFAVCAGGGLQRLLGVQADAPCAIGTPRHENWVATASVYLGDTAVLSAGVAAGGQVVLRPAGPHLLVRAMRGVAPSVEDLASSGTVWLVGSDEHGVLHREPLAEWAR
jgi:hypothetical protein